MQDSSSNSSSFIIDNVDVEVDGSHRDDSYAAGIHNGRLVLIDRCHDFYHKLSSAQSFYSLESVHLKMRNLRFQLFASNGEYDLGGAAAIAQMPVKAISKDEFNELVFMCN